MSTVKNKIGAEKIKSNVLINQVSVQDFEEIQELQLKVYPNIRPWTKEQLENHLKVFPEGQFVARLDGKVVGTANSLIILWDEYGIDHNWREVTGFGTFNTHNIEGRTLYGAEVCVDPSYQKKGIGHKLYEARRALCRELNLKRIIAAGRLPNYFLYADKMSPELYAMKVIWGDIYDPVLRFQIGEGFQFCGIVENYLHGDKESLEYASLIVWINKDYRPE